MHASFSARLALLVGFLLLTLPAPTQAQRRGLRRQAPPACRQVGGVVSGTWTRAGSPYCVTEDLTVGPGSLTIESGVQVRVAADVSIRVTGALVVQGTSLAPVLFTSTDPGAPWAGLFFDQATLASSLELCRIEGANDGGVRILDSAVSLLGCEIAGNTREADGGGLWASIASGDLVLQDCRITGNTADGGDGGGLWVSLASGDLVLQDCDVSDNTALVVTGGFPYLGGNGGGLSATLADGDLLLERCELTRNRAVQDPIGTSGQALGGGLQCTGASSVVLDDCLIAQNESFAYNDFPQLQFRAGGGGIYVAGAALRLTRCIVRDNRAAGSYPFPLSNGGAPFASGGGLCHEGAGHGLTSVPASQRECQGASGGRRPIPSPSTGWAVSPSWTQRPRSWTRPLRTPSSPGLQSADGLGAERANC